MKFRKLWLAFASVVVASFAVLGYFGWEIYRQAPPIPGRVVTTDGEVLFTGQNISDGQNVWQSMGGQEVGTVWGHGAYLAPDWSADWLHREATVLLEYWSNADHGGEYASLGNEQQAALRARLRTELRTNTYDAQTGDLLISTVRARAIREVGTHYAKLFGDDETLSELRDAYAIPANTIKTPERQSDMNAFFFWVSWACATNRPGSDITYTNNWPAESLIDNRPTGSIVVWSVVSFVVLLAGIGALSWHFAIERGREETPHGIPSSDPLLDLKPTPSMMAALKYFWVVTAMIVVQVILGAITAHYGVEGSGFYGIPLAKWLPYAVTRTWHSHHRHPRRSLQQGAKFAFGAAQVARPLLGHRRLDLFFDRSQSLFLFLRGSPVRPVCAT